MNKLEKAVTKAALTPPEKLKAIMLKIRKGSTAAITLPYFPHIVELVGGAWKLELEFLQMHDDKYPIRLDIGLNRDIYTEEPFHIADLDRLHQLHEQYKASEVATLPTSANPGQRFNMQVSPIRVRPQAKFDDGNTEFAFLE